MQISYQIRCLLAAASIATHTVHAQWADFDEPNYDGITQYS